MAAAHVLRAAARTAFPRRSAASRPPPPRRRAPCRRRLRAWGCPSRRRRPALRLAGPGRGRGARAEYRRRVGGRRSGHFPRSGRRARSDPMPEIAGKVADSFESAVREHEERWLSPLAVRSYETRGRNLPEEECRLRTPFQRDRDRIVHSKAFRRLRHKTQVFVDPEGDHFRTRLTHTLETTGIARGVARALRLNEDLDRGDRARPRPRSPAVRPRRRAGARRAAARARRPRLPPQRALAARRRAARARRARAQPDVGGARRDPQAHRRRGAGDARGADRAPRRPRRLHQPRHRRRDPRRRCSRRATCRASRSPLLGDTGSRRIDTLVHDLVETSAAAGDIVQSDEVGERDARAARVHVRARLPPAGSPAPRTERAVRRRRRRLLALPARSPRGRARRRAAGACPVEHATDYLARA